jgi:hypothetical protein
MGQYHIGEAIAHIKKNTSLGNGLRSAAIEEVWAEIMGKTIAKYTDKIEIKKNTVFIDVTIGPLKSELMYQRKLIIQRINEHFGDQVVSEVIIR